MRDSLQKLGAADVELRVGRSGQFDVTVDGTLKYTRSKTGRFPTDDEVEDILANVTALLVLPRLRGGVEESRTTSLQFTI